MKVKCVPLSTRWFALFATSKSITPKTLLIILSPSKVNVKLKCHGDVEGVTKSFISRVLSGNMVMTPTKTRRICSHAPNRRPRQYPRIMGDPRCVGRVVRFWATVAGDKMVMKKAFGFSYEPIAKSIEWYTPPCIFDALGLQFDLDPCSPGQKVVDWIPAKKHFTIADNGLEQDWFGKVWMNPPYGTGLPKWMYKFSKHGNGVALIPSRTDTQWFQEYAGRAGAICFVSGRIKFISPTDARKRSPGAGSLLIAFGSECVKALKNSNLGLTFQRLEKI